jgi:hypothetical protein
MEVNKLTDIEVKKAKAKDKPYAMSDGAGLYVWVTTAGGKLWRWGYRFGEREKLMSYGKYPDVTIVKARELHQVARSLLASGIDPMAERKAKKEAKNLANRSSFSNVSELWLNHWQVSKSKRYVETVRQRVKDNILPALGSRPISKIDSQDIVKMVTAIQDRGARDIAKRALQITKQIFRYGKAHGYTKYDSAAGIVPRDVLEAANVVNFARIDRQQLPDLLKAIEVYRGTQKTRLAMKLMALSFLRTKRNDRSQVGGV